MIKEYIKIEAALTELNKVCDLCMALVAKPMCGECSVAGTVRKIKRIPAADVKPVAEISDAVDEAIRILNAINSRGNERFDYGDYCELHDAISAICPNCGCDMRREEDNESSDRL